MITDTLRVFNLFYINFYYFYKFIHFIFNSTMIEIETHYPPMLDGTYFEIKKHYINENIRALCRYTL